jgi:hypothetical protein
MSDLSPTMREALDYASKHGGLVRFPGGYWCKSDETQWNVGWRSFSTSTVNALVSRGHAEYTEWKDGRNGSFPVRMAVK